MNPRWFSVLLLLRAVASLDVSGGAADQAALLQMDAAVLTKVSSAEVKRAVRDIKDASAGLVIKDAGRRSAFDTLMQHMEQIDKLNPENAELLTNITELLESLLAELVQERDVDQIMIDAIFAAVSSCNADGVDEDLSLANIVQAAALNHTQCRTEEETYFQNDYTTCAALIAFLNNLSPPECVGGYHPAVNQEGFMDTWTDHFTNDLNWFTTNQASYIQARDDCLLASAELQAKNEECDQNQTGYENHFCEWRLHRVDRCTTLTSCYTTAIEDHLNLTGHLRPVSAQRVIEAGVIEHVVCLINNLVNNGITNVTECVMQINETYNQVTYGNVFPDPLPAQDECLTTPVDVYPGMNQTWYTWAYSHLSNTTPAVSDTGIHCHQR